MRGHALPADRLHQCRWRLCPCLFTTDGVRSWVPFSSAARGTSEVDIVPYVFLGLHILWAVPCVLVSIWLASATGGHPPGIVFVPFVVAAWIGGHLTLGLTRWLLSRGLRAGGFPTSREAYWAPSVLIGLVSCGLIGFGGLAAIVRGVVFGKPPTVIWLGLLGIWSTHTVCFSGLALRQSWARWLAGSLCGLWTLWCVVLLGEHVLHGRRTSMGEVLLALGLIAVLALLAQRLLIGRGARRYFQAYRHESDHCA
jgi:hypothetical protein